MRDVDVLYMPGTSECFFYDACRRKWGSVPGPCVFWVGRRVGGREWDLEVTLGYLVLCIKLHYAICRFNFDRLVSVCRGGGVAWKSRVIARICRFSFSNVSVCRGGGVAQKRRVIARTGVELGEEDRYQKIRLVIRMRVTSSGTPCIIDIHSEIM